MSKPRKPKKGRSAVNTTPKITKNKTKKQPPKPAIGNETWLDNSDLRRSFNVTARTLLNWLKKGVVRYKKLGGKILYCERELLQLLAKPGSNTGE